MTFRKVIGIIGATTVTGCATTTDIIDQSSRNTALLNATSERTIDNVKAIQKGDFLLELKVTPQHMVKIVEKQKIELQQSGDIKIPSDTRLFSTQLVNGNKLFCGFDYLHINAVRTLLNEACFADENNDKRFDTFYTRLGPNNKNLPKFFYQDSEVNKLDPTLGQVSIPYQMDVTDPADSYFIAFRYKEMKKKKGKKRIIIDILTKKTGEENWSYFMSRTPVEVVIEKGSDSARLSTPLFELELSNPTYRKVDTLLVSKNSNGSFGFKASLKPPSIKSDGYSPAYQTKGF